LFPQQIFFRDENIFEADEHVADAAQSHELTAMRDLDAGRVHLENESSNLLFLFALHDLGGGTRHHDNDFSLEAVGAPKFFAVEDPTFPSGDGTACVSILAGSLPTPGSVKANAEIAPFGSRGSHFS